MDKMLEDNVKECLPFWFGQQTNGLSARSQQQLWYSASPEQELQMKQRFLPLHQAIFEDVTSVSDPDPEVRLGLIILFDQMSRNFFRGTARAFAYDDFALQLCLRGLELGHHRHYTVSERLFYYHPLEHAEELAHQDLCVELMAKMVDEASEEMREACENGLQYAKVHRDIIEKFGRFPHRNSVLNRKSTQAEEVYLNQGGHRFGQ